LKAVLPGNLPGKAAFLVERRKSFSSMDRNLIPGTLFERTEAGWENKP